VQQRGAPLLPVSPRAERKWHGPPTKDPPVDRCHSAPIAWLASTSNTLQCRKSGLTRADHTLQRSQPRFRASRLCRGRQWTTTFRCLPGLYHPLITRPGNSTRTRNQGRAMRHGTPTELNIPQMLSTTRVNTTQREVACTTARDEEAREALANLFRESPTTTTATTREVTWEKGFTRLGQSRKGLWLYQQGTARRREWTCRRQTSWNGCESTNNTNNLEEKGEPTHHRKHSDDHSPGWIPLGAIKVFFELHPILFCQCASHREFLHEHSAKMKSWPVVSERTAPSWPDWGICDTKCTTTPLPAPCPMEITKRVLA
jgi:hypothetical protein